jgi:hypothetical protein
MIWLRLSKWLLPNVKIIQPGCWSCHQHSRAASAISATCSKHSTPHTQAFLHMPEMMSKSSTMEMCLCAGSCLSRREHASFAGHLSIVCSSLLDGLNPVVGPLLKIGCKPPHFKGMETTAQARRGNASGSYPADTAAAAGARRRRPSRCWFFSHQ